MRKVVLVIAGVFLASFVLERVASFAQCRGGGSTAWAQSWGNSSGDASSEGDDSESKSPPPDIAGTYTGTVVDHRFGSGGVTIMISQNGSNLTGTFTTFFNSGSVKGTVKSSGKVKLRLTQEGHCGANFHGMFQSGDEIIGTYHVTGCGGKADGGSVEVTD